MYDTIVVGTDGSPTATKAVEHAAALAALAGATLHVGMAAPNMPVLATPDMMVATDEWAKASNEATRAGLAAAAEIATAAGAAVETHALDGDPADALLSLCDQLDADLLVVGNRGMHGARRFFLGSVSNRCAHHADTSVLIVDTQ
jgi:nucleotide-binding universal stress UspA family protein